MKSSITNMILSLGGISLVAAGLLAGVNLLTEEPIAKAKSEALRQALQAVLPPFDNEVVADTLASGAVLYRATLEGVPSGTAVESFSDNGFGGRITVLFGFDRDGAVKGYRLLSHAETPGLGAKADTWFAEEGSTHSILNTTSPLRVKNDGGDIDAITGATITSRAFLEALDAARQAVESLKTEER